jgi:ABC-type polysaccharide/polyol phosphate export permease
VLFEAYRSIIYAGTTPAWSQLGVLTLVSIILLAVATWLFKRVEPAFAKIL